MKYTILINQYAIAKLGLDKKTDIIDWAIIDYLKDWVFSSKKKTLVLEGKEFIWINYSHLLKEMPLLEIKDKHTIGERIKKYKVLGLLETFQAKDNTLYFRFTENLEKLFFEDTCVDEQHRLCGKTTQPMPENHTGAMGKIHAAQLYNQSNSFINHITNKDIVPYKEIIEYLNHEAGTRYKYSSKTTREHIHARWEEKFTLDDFKTVINKKCAEWLNDPKMVKFLRPETLFGTKFESYLNTPQIDKQITQPQTQSQSISDQWLAMRKAARGE